MKIQLLKPLFLLLGLLFVVGCQEDFINEENISTEPDQSRKLFFDYKTIDYVIKEESALRKSVQKIQQNEKDLTSSVYNFSFDENKVQIMQDSTYTQYTFLIKRDNPIDYMVENYICRVYQNDSVQQFITSYPVIETQDSLEIDYTSGSIQKIQDDAIDVSKMAETCVPVFEEQEIEVTVPCTDPGGANHTDPDNCSCGDIEGCEPPSTTTEIITIFTLDCENVGGGDSGDGYDGSNNNDPNGPSYGGGNNDSDSSDYPILTDPVEPELLLKQPVREYFENLEDDKKDCYENSGLTVDGSGSSLTDSMIDDIEEFLNENTTNGVTDPEAQAFADAILEDCDSGQDVDFEERIIDDGLTGKEECLHDQLKDLDNNFIEDLLSNFTGESTEFGIRIKSKDHVYRTDADGNSVEVSGITNYQPDESIIEININSTEANSNRALHVLRTILHEYIHAEITRKIYTDDDSSHLDNFNSIFNSYEDNGFQPTPAHQTMAQLYVKSMQEVIKDFHMQMMTPDYNNLLTGMDDQLNLDNFYEALAWKGLEQHGVQAWIDLPQDRKDELDQAYQQYIFSTTHNCITD